MLNGFNISQVSFYIILIEKKSKNFKEKYLKTKKQQSSTQEKQEAINQTLLLLK